jgi:hypothetical protein
MVAGTAAHAALHCNALREVPAQAGDGRCFVATALWGPTDPRTQALREWRDFWLLKRGWGRAVTRLYYWLSPQLVDVMATMPRLRAAVSSGLSAVAHRVAAPRA